MNEKGKFSEINYQSVIEKLSVGIIKHNKQGEIIYANPMALELLGLSKEQLLGKSPYDPDWNVIHPNGQPFPGFSHPAPQCIFTKKPVRDVIMGVYRPKFKNIVWLMVDAEPFFD